MISDATSDRCLKTFESLKDGITMLDTSHLSGSSNKLHAHTAGTIFDSNSSPLMSLGMRSHFSRAAYQDSRFSSQLDIHAMMPVDALSTPKKGHPTPSNQTLIPDRFGLKHLQGKSLVHPSASDFGFGVSTNVSTSHDDLLGGSPKAAIQRKLTSTPAIDAPTQVIRAKAPALNIDSSTPAISVPKSQPRAVPLGSDPSDSTPISVIRAKAPVFNVDSSTPAISVPKSQPRAVPLGSDPSDSTPISVIRAKAPVFNVDSSTISPKSQPRAVPLGNQT
jgi:hypothetical protein